MMISYRQADILKKVKEQRDSMGSVSFLRIKPFKNDMWVMQSILADCPEALQIRILQCVSEAGAEDLSRYGYGFEIRDRLRLSIIGIMNIIKKNMKNNGLELIKSNFRADEATIYFRMGK